VTAHLVHPPHCTEPVHRPVMLMEWRTITFLHWRYDVADVQRLLPAALEVEERDGAAWAGLVPFSMVVRPPGVPELPWVSRFPETNVRTYVRGPKGRTGVWFFSLDAGRLPAVVTARATYRLPYFWSRMQVRRDGGQVTYVSSRRWPGPAGARSSVRVRVEAPYDPSELTEFDHYLTARFGLFARTPGGRLTYSPAEHPPWPLRRATVLERDDTLVAAAGLPEPSGDPIAHFSDGVAVRVGPPSVVGR
jgi:uncharacterized protein YqjF (DUF2071 family)